MPDAGFRILLVEDHEALGRLMKLELNRAGWEVVGPVPDLPGASAAVERGGFDLVLLDRMLRGLDSFPLLDRLLARGFPSIIVSGYPRHNLPDRFQAVPLLEKPFTTEGLVAAVRAAIEGGLGQSESL